MNVPHWGEPGGLRAGHADNRHKTGMGRISEQIWPGRFPMAEISCRLPPRWSKSLTIGR